MSTEAKVWWAEDFVQQDFPYEPVIEDRILALGEKLLIVGPSEAGKSYLGLQMALELASAGDFFTRRVPRSFKVLIVQAEVAEGEYQERLRKLLSSYKDLPAHHLAITTVADLKVNTQSGFQRLSEAITAVAPHVLVIDPLRAFFRGDENDSNVGDEFYSAIDGLSMAAPNPLTFIGIHHVRKPSLEFHDDGKYAARGNSVWTDRPSTVLGLTCNNPQTVWTLQYHKTRARTKHPPTQQLSVNYTTGLFELVEGAGAEYLTVLRNALAAGPQLWANLKQELSNTCGVSVREVERWVADAEREGLICRWPDPLHLSRKLIGLNGG